MSLFINTNSEALIAQNNLTQTENALSTATTDLSSGLRINTAADDAAGYSIVADLTGQVNGLNQASNNAQDAVSLVQTADGGLNDVQQVLQRVRELAVEYNGGTLNTQDQNAIVSEVGQLAAEISDIQNQSQFNGISLFNGSQATLTFQVGANDGDTISVNLTNLSSITAGVSTLANTAGALGASNVLSTIDGLINDVSESASSLGAVQNRLSYTLNNLSTYSENLSAAQSTIQDVDMAAETSVFTQQQILEQSGISMLSQAEQAPQQVLKLIQNL
ncbi:flagellin [Conexibacter sp. DBS9H8]|uniref:flagellin N-terminal helical domain-containing protein n=1 Tax=Conexibacter sp. DBS9H8 TaxID=2937801 RepID=UPI00200E3A60|nr:flagellin [Conexibacter sp. DBS9H8]